MRILIYLRVSSEGQSRKENPIATQKAACLEYAQRNDHEVDSEKDIYVDDGISGRSATNRFAFKAMLARLKADKDVVGVIAYDTSRISRNLRVYLEFKDYLKKYGKKFFSISEPYFNDDNPVAILMEQIMASFSEFRSGQDGLKIKEAMKRKGEAGLYPGRAPYGYKNVRGEDYGGKEKRWMETDPVTAPWVKEMFSKYASERYSFGSLADELNERGCPTYTKKPWIPSSVEKVLKKKTYIGWIDWSDVDNPNGQHEKLVDENTFYKVQALMRARNYGANRMRKHSFILRGFTYCDECGSRITASYHTKKSGKIYAFYLCSKRQHSKPVLCGQSAIQTKELERQLEKLIKTIQIPESTALRLEEKIKEVVANDKESNEVMRKSIQLQLNNIDGKKKALLEKHLDGSVDADTYKNFKLELEAKEVQLQADLEKVNEVILSIVSKVETAIGLARNCHKTYQNAPYEQKTLLAQTFFAKVTVKDQSIEKAFLNHPFVYVCRTKASRVPAFQYQYAGGDGGIETPSRNITNGSSTSVFQLRTEQK